MMMTSHFKSCCAVRFDSLAGGQRSGATQQRPGIIAVVLRLMKMLDSAAFYTLSGNSPVVFLI